jgi:hypothetical protein
MKIIRLLAVAIVVIVIATAACLSWLNTAAESVNVAIPKVALTVSTTSWTEARVRKYLDDKKSPLASETQFLLTRRHWKLLIAISAIESQYCKRKIDFNCWGIGGDSAYRHYKSLKEAITDADALIEKWQAKGRWLTTKDMNCSYVVPCNQNWVTTVNHVLEELKGF